MQLLQILLLLDTLCGLFGLMDLDEGVPLMRDMICWMKCPPSGDGLEAELGEHLLCASSANKLLSGVCGLPLLPFRLCRPLSTQPAPTLESIVPLLKEAEAEGT